MILVERWIEGDRNARVKLWQARWDLRKWRLRLAKWTAWALIGLATPMTLEAFALTVKDALRASCVQIVGAVEQPVQRVAIVCGSGGEFLADAAARKADVFLTGEARFHDCEAARAQHVALVLPGRFASERIGVEALADRLKSQFPNLQIWASRRERDPLAVV